MTSPADDGPRPYPCGFTKRYREHYIDAMFLAGVTSPPEVVRFELCYRRSTLALFDMALSGGNPPAKPVSSEVEFSHYEGILHEEVTILGQPDHGGTQAG